jgi:hypothetical protein
VLRYSTTLFQLQLHSAKWDGGEVIFEAVAHFEVLCQHRLEWIAIWRINTLQIKPIKRGNHFLSFVNIIFNKMTHIGHFPSRYNLKKYKASEARSAFVIMFYILLGPTNRDLLSHISSV